MVAGEASGDLLGADLISALKRQYPQAQFHGIGGEKMCAQGLQTWFPMQKLSVMGFFEVIKHLPELLSIRRFCIKQTLQLKPQAFIGIDAPDFNFKIEGAAKKAGIPAIHYVGPSVWAWREKRLLKIKQQVDGVLVLFPFELPYYQKYGIPAQYVGHPLATQVLKAPNKQGARQQLGLSSDALVTGLLPGSRMSEIALMADVYIQVAVKIQTIHTAMVFVIPCVHEVAKSRIEKAVMDYGQGLKIILLDQQPQLVMAAADQLLVTSGTATLEAALMQRPMVLAMKVHPISYWIMKRLATTEWIGLPNILAKKLIVPELIQLEATVENITLALGKLIQDQKQRDMQLSEFKKQAKQLHQNTSALTVEAIKKWAHL
ncbi:lipid-A-disaccharide synthase [Hydrogenovibrio sp. SC-1]|nr:lipid-A-disaccharide synthase [Hydrogenovibrio sp. SC-1]